MIMYNVFWCFLGFNYVEAEINSGSLLCGMKFRSSGIFWSEHCGMVELAPSHLGFKMTIVFSTRESSVYRYTGYHFFITAFLKKCKLKKTCRRWRCILHPNHYSSTTATVAELIFNFLEINYLQQFKHLSCRCLQQFSDLYGVLPRILQFRFAYRKRKSNLAGI